jgi:hypothetical protein
MHGKQKNDKLVPGEWRMIGGLIDTAILPAIKIEEAQQRNELGFLSN